VLDRFDDPVPVRDYVLRQVLLVPMALVVAALLAHYSGLDVVVENYFYDAEFNGFPWDKSVPLEFIGHRVFKYFPVAFALAALGGVAASYRFAGLQRWRSLLWATIAALVLGPTVVSLLKHQSNVYCPSSLKMYGGYADYTTAWWSLKPQGGRCMPSGHAGAGFAMVTLFFAGWASGRPSWRRWGLHAGIACGVMFSVVRFMQGAHFPSHVLWSASLDWLAASLVFLPFAIKGRMPALRWRPATTTVSSGVVSAVRAAPLI
jgi:membrane-associated PAP2 superfamily phosphatase